ncbi:MAG: DUF3017 domain-containing protein [Actinocrinis sp.]
MELASRREGTSPARAVRALATEWPFAVVFTTAAIAVIVVSLGGLKRGLTLLAAALLVGSVLRFVLPPARAGLLAVRRRGVDVVTMALLGVFLLLLALFADTV